MDESWVNTWAHCKKTFLIQTVINDGWHVLQRILIKGTIFLLKVIIPRVKWMKKKKKKRKLVKIDRQILSITDTIAINFI